MTRRDYILLADCFKATLTAEGAATLSHIAAAGVRQAARDMAYRLALVNPKFDQALFLRNAGVID